MRINFRPYESENSELLHLILGLPTIHNSTVRPAGAPALALQFRTTSSFPVPYAMIIGDRTPSDVMV